MILATLEDLCTIMRSKNAGPFQLSVDFLFSNKENYEKVKKSRVLTKKLVADLYHLKPEIVQIYEFDPANAIKITIPRTYSSGEPNDYDVYGAQQHVPLSRIEIPE